MVGDFDRGGSRTRRQNETGQRFYRQLRFRRKVAWDGRDLHFFEIARFGANDWNFFMANRHARPTRPRLHHESRNRHRVIWQFKFRKLKSASFELESLKKTEVF